ncbi:hypothetical protein Tco_0337878, partial [Tanacetum coccineum]
MSTPVFVDPDISTQADGSQSPQVPVPFLEDPFEAIRQAYLVETDIESERFEDSYETAPPASPPDLPSRKHSQGTSELVEDDEVEDEE